MKAPNLKRVKINSAQELEHWLAKNADQKQDILLVTHAASSKDKHVSKVQIQQAVESCGWESGLRYTLNPHLVGHVIHPG